MFKYFAQKTGLMNPKDTIPNNARFFLNAGLTPFHLASVCGNIDICKYMIENLDDKNPSSNYGDTPLHCATWIPGSFEVFEIIFEHVED